MVYVGEKLGHIQMASSKRLSLYAPARAKAIAKAQVKFYYRSQCIEGKSWTSLKEWSRII